MPLLEVLTRQNVLGQNNAIPETKRQRKYSNAAASGGQTTKRPIPEENSEQNYENAAARGAHTTKRLMTE